MILEATGAKARNRLYRVSDNPPERINVAMPGPASLQSLWLLLAISSLSQGIRQYCQIGTQIDLAEVLGLQVVIRLL